MNLTGKKVKETIYQTITALGGEQKKVVKSLEFEDGTRMVEGEVIPPKSVVDRLMDGERVRDSFCAEFDHAGMHTTKLSSIKVKGCYLLAGNTKIDIFDKVKILQLNGEPVDLDELRRRVAIREIKRLAQFADLASLGELLPGSGSRMPELWPMCKCVLPQEPIKEEWEAVPDDNPPVVKTVTGWASLHEDDTKPDMSKEWWDGEDFSELLLSADKMYQYQARIGIGKHFAYGRDFFWINDVPHCPGIDGEEVLRIKEVD